MSIQQSFLLPLLLIILLANPMFGQSNIGIQMDLGLSTITGISKDNEFGYGHSNRFFKTKIHFNYLPSLRIRHGLANFKIEYGIGYQLSNQRICLNNVLSSKIDDFSTFNMKFQYWHIPIQLLYQFPLKNKNKLIFGIGTHIKLMKYYKDNYQEIIYENILLINDRYQKYVYDGHVSISYQFSNTRGGGFELGLYGNYDLTPHVLKSFNWGFYERLQTARYLRSGISLKYFY